VRLPPPTHARRARQRAGPLRAMAMISNAQLEDLAEEKAKQLKAFLETQPPVQNGEDLLRVWEQLYDEEMQKVVVKTVSGPSDDETNPVFPYEKLQAIIGDGGNWKWPRMWQRFDELERRGPAYREGEHLNFGMPSKNPNIVPLRVLIVGGGPVGMRLAIELALGGHKVTIFEKRREIRTDDGGLQQLGFTNRINRPHMWNFVRNDLAKLNGKDFMSREACYPVFTEPETSSIGIDELQVLLMKSVLMLGVDFRLGVGYDGAKVRTDPRTMKPTWEVECTYDDTAAKKHGMESGKNKQVFDAIVGCDGPRSNVRETQSKHFGNLEKRKFMDCVGIVANVRKVGKKRLKEMGFEHGQEPGDMNRTKMVFKEFFQKIQAEADADIENLIYYKSSYHNYLIIVPKRADLVKRGLSGKVYHFGVGRDNAAADMRSDEKEKLKGYCRRVLKAAGIPVDEQLENGGFVDAPNDCMAFDFAECWNTKKSIIFNVPPPDYDVEQHGQWMCRNLVPPLALCGDALLEPFWPMGLGLKRGWQAIMDTCYAFDNIYNRTLFCERLKQDPENFAWDQHFDALRDQIAQNFENCARLKIGEELGKGEYADKGPVITQLKKFNKDAEKPPLEVEIDPWTRYAPLEKERGDEWKLKVNDEKWIHPKVQKALNMKEYYDEVAKGGKTGEIEYRGKKLISVNGKVVPGFGKAGFTKRPSFASTVQPTGPPPPPGAKFGVNPFANVVAKEALAARASLKPPPAPASAPATPAAEPTAVAPGALPPQPSRASVASFKTQEAELKHIRNMIASLESSLASFRQAEADLVARMPAAA